MTQIIPNQTFLHDGSDWDATQFDIGPKFKEGNTYDVPPEAAKLFMKNGWVGTGGGTEDDVTLEIDDLQVTTLNETPGVHDGQSTN